MHKPCDTGICDVANCRDAECASNAVVLAKVDPEIVREFAKSETKLGILPEVLKKCYEVADRYRKVTFYFFDFKGEILRTDSMRTPVGLTQEKRKACIEEELEKYGFTLDK